MKLSDLFRRQAHSEETFDKLESNLSNALLLDVESVLTSDGEPASQQEVAEGFGASEEGSAEAAAEPEPGSKLTSHTQSRIAEFAAFEHMHNSVQTDLETVSVMLAQIKVAYHQTREFLNSVHASIYRTNELELEGAKLSTENRLLARRSEYVDRLRSQFESLTEAFKHREAKLVETADALRGSLSSAKIELVEAQGRITFLESEQHNTLNTLAAASTQSERAVRENEVLREKLINLSSDLEQAGRKRVESDRRVDELSAMHARDSADLAEMRSRVAALDGERQRLQKQHDALQAQFTEMTEALAASETETADQGKRHDIGMQNLRNERDTLAARLEISIRAEQEAAERAIATANERNDAQSARRIAEERAAKLAEEQQARAEHAEELAGLRRENERLQALLGAQAGRDRASGPHGPRRAAQARPPVIVAPPSPAEGAAPPV